MLKIQNIHSGGVASMVYKCFDKNSASVAQSQNIWSETLTTRATGDKSAPSNGIKIYVMSNQQLVEELHKIIIKEFEKLKVYESFKDNIWGADLAGMQLISNFNKGFRFLLCVIGSYSKYVRDIP